MKLLHCIACQDILALREEHRTCACGASGGRYVDPLWAEHHGPSRVLGMRNDEIARSLREEHVPFEGPHYRWFVLTEGGHIRRSDGADGVRAFDAAVRAREETRARSLNDLAKWVREEAGE